MSLTDRIDESLQNASFPEPSQPDSIRLALQDSDRSTTGTTVVLPERREYDVALLMSLIAMAPTGGDDTSLHADLMPVPVAADPLVPFRADLIERLRSTLDQVQVVVLRLPPEMPGTALLHEMAATLRSHAEIIGTTPPRVLWYAPASRGRLRDLPGMAQALADQSHCLVLVAQADRSQLGRDLAQLRASLNGRTISILATTQLDSNVWRLGEHEQPHWIDLTNERPYNTRFLADELRHGLAERLDRFPTTLQQLQSDGPLLAGRTLPQVAAALGSPLRVRALLWLIDQPGATLRDPVRLLAQALRMPVPDLVRIWFTALGRYDQLLAAALSLLEGLPEGQLFPALEELHERVWSLRPPGHPMLDLADLAPLSALITLDERGPADSRLDLAIDGLRPALIAPVVAAHRRHLQHAQLWLASLVITSIQHGAEQPHPFLGPPHARVRLRAAAAAALADLALAVPILARPALLVLAAHGHPEAHRTLARALARWYAIGHGDRLVELLTDLQRDDQARSLIITLRHADAEPNANGADVVELLRVIGLLTLTEAARTAPIGSLEPALVNLLADLARPAEGRMARQILREETLPVLLHDHVGQLEPLLRELIRYADLQADLSGNLAEAYRAGGARARAVNDMLQNWLAEGLRGRRAGRAEEKLVAAASVLGAIDYRQHGPLSLDGAWRYLRLILDHLDGSQSRAAVLAACMRLAGQDPRQLRWALSAMREDEEELVLASLTAICREQRDALRLRPPEQHDQRDYWPDGEPKSALERVLITWLLRDPRQDRPGDLDIGRLRSLVLYAFVDITQSLDLLPGQMPNRPRPASLRHAAPQSFYRQRVMPILMADHTPSDVLTVLRSILADVLHIAQNDADTFEVLMRRWGSDSDLGELGAGMRLAVELDTAGDWGLRSVGLSELARAVFAALRG